jgi:hypothetical protein
MTLSAPSSASGRPLILDPISEAYQIVMQEQGRAVERGSHGELMALDGLYVELWRRQASERFSPEEGL